GHCSAAIPCHRDLPALQHPPEKNRKTEQLLRTVGRQPDRRPHEGPQNRRRAKKTSSSARNRPQTPCWSAAYPNGVDNLHIWGRRPITTGKPSISEPSMPQRSRSQRACLAAPGEIIWSAHSSTLRSQWTSRLPPHPGG